MSTGSTMSGRSNEGRHLDVVFVTDPRLNGGGNKSIAEEARVLAGAGHRVGLLPLASPLKGSARPVDHSLGELLDERMLEMVRPDEPVRCRLLVGRGPAIFAEPQAVRPMVRTDRAILVLNAVHADASRSDLAYDPGALAAAASELFGFDWELHPLSEVVRDGITAIAPDVPLAPTSWGNIIDVDRWWRPTVAPVRRPLRIGRHSRDHVSKWPDTAEEILEVYPEDPDVEVRVLGGAHALRDLLAYVPANWQVHRFGEQEVRSFLHGLDFYVYYHASWLVEAFGRAPLEALASGAIAVLPPYLEKVFGEAAIYAERADALAVVHRLAADEPAYRQQLERARQEISERYGPAAYARRLGDLVGGPAARTGPHADLGSAPGAGTDPVDVDESTRRPRHDVSRPSVPSRRPTALFFTDNGVGLGHVTRLMAMARRLGDDVQPAFLTMSESHSVVRDAGFPVEYFPSARKLGIDRDRWAPVLDRRLRLMIARLRPEVLVIDHVAPSSAFRGVRGEFPHLRMVWSRRGLWQPGRNLRALQMSDAFDLVIEPADVAASMDRGATVGAAGEIHTVRPVTLLSRDELLPRDVARRELGLSGQAALVQLTADDPRRLHEMICSVRDHLAQLGVDQVFAPLHILHRRKLAGVTGVSMRPVYPISRYLNAFDTAVSTAGYNSFHELIMAGVPSVYVAKEHRGLDDQRLRADFAEIGGFGWTASSVESEDFHGKLAATLDPDAAERARAAAHALYPGNGAVDAATIIRELALGATPAPQEVVV